MAALMAPASHPTVPIRRLLIANRGEIAVRIAATAHRMGIATVGVHSAPDADALHVRSVDVAVSLGGATPAESYLRADAVLEAALATGCDAVHPGYGFLAEQPEAASMMIDAGVRWVGPTPEQIALLGDKVAAKRAAVAAGVPTAGFVEVRAGQVPDDVGMPALVKAAAGGGGRGMRIVRSRGELSDAIVAASREAKAAFGDGTVFIEPYLERGRHVEVQILGDEHGNVIHLGNRDCSVQRRNQKVIEEAPAPFLGTDVRHQLHEGALALARHVGYRNAGTVEFMVGADGTVNFLEVNTRLQVEHPVTEAVTGLDLVELQLLVASGAELPLRQEDVGLDGHAIEVRVVAEDPGVGWLPSTGTLEHVDVPATVRCDSGVVTGSTVGADYDSLLAKVVAWAPDRGGAAATLARALHSSTVIGVRTNLAMLAATREDVAFRDGVGSFVPVQLLPLLDDVRSG
ncbi:MAG: acetyl/propionyl/methylcrotonyl-CoA carboxylase subunit alpha, partial [Microthrixaceae bacterium]